LKPARFAYARPDTIEDALALLDEHGYDAKIISGGQSLVPMMNLRLARPDVLVDVNRLQGLNRISTANGTLAIGALTRQDEVARSPEVAEQLPLLADAMRYVGHPATRNRGTFGGTIAHADPAAESPAVLLALGGEVEARSSSGTRTIDADDFFQSYLTSALEDNEILTEVRLRRPPAGSRWAFNEVARRHGDFALVGLAATAEPDGSGNCGRARFVFLGVGLVPFRVRAAEELLEGRPLGDASVAADVERAVAEAIPSVSDVHASGEYRKEVAGVLARRAVEQMASQGGAA
jgi:aerobic carbon-monoxide dehydrogenase medium subunit